LDVSQNINLIKLGLTQNSLTSLNVTNNTKLNDLSCGNNNLKNLDVSSIKQLEKFYCLQNPELYTICISELQEIFGWKKDAQASYSTSCILTSSTQNINPNTNKKLIGTYNLQGQLVNEGATGLLINVYNDGSKEKIIVE